MFLSRADHTGADLRGMDGDPPAAQALDHHWKKVAEAEEREHSPGRHARSAPQAADP